jgi:hypothetical protein
MPNKGCFRDKNDSIEIRQKSLNYELYFAGQSGTWGNGGVLVLPRRLSVFVWHIVPFFLRGAGLPSHLKRRRRRPGRGDGWGDSFQGGPECCPSVLAADQGRRCRQREQERITRKKEWSALRRNCLQKTRRPRLGATWNASVPAPVEQCQAAVRGGRMKRRKFYYKS